MQNRRILLLCVCALIAGVLPFYRVVLDPGKALLFRDLSLGFLPGKWIWLQGFTTEWRVPRWNYFFGGGLPFYGDVSLSPLCPLNIIFLLFPQSQFLYAFTIFIVAHYALLFTGIYSLLRALRARWELALALSFAFVWGGGPISAASSIMIVGSLIGVTYFFTFWLYFLRKKIFIHLVLASLFLAWPIYFGEPQYSYVLACLAVAMAILYRSPWQRPLELRARVIAVAQLLTLAFLCGAMQILPTLEVSQLSARGFARLADASVFAWSLHPMRVLEFFFPLFFGNLVPQNTFWGAPFINAFNGGGLPFSFSFYLGAAIIFALLAWFSLCVSRGRFQPKGSVRLLILGSSIGLLIVFGVFSPIPLYKFLVDYLPLWRSFRYPERLTHFVTLGILILAMISWRKLLLFSVISKMKKWRAAFGIFLCLFVLFLASGFFLSQSFTPPQETFLHFALFLGLLTLLFCSMIFKKIPRRIFFLCFSLISSMDLFLVAKNLVWESPGSIASADTYPLSLEIQRDLADRQQNIAAGAARRFTVPNLYAGTADYSKSQNILDMPGQIALGIWDNLVPGTSAVFNIEDMATSNTFVPLAKIQLLEAFKSEHEKLLALQGVYYLGIRNAQGQLVLKKNDTALPYIFLPQTIHNFSDRAKAAKYMQSPSFDMRHEAIILGERTALSAEKTASVTVKILRRAGNGMQLQLIADQDLQNIPLIWNENYYPRWRALVAEKPIPIFLANLWAMGIQIPELRAGKPVQVDFSFDDSLILWGKILSTVWLLIGGIVAYFSKQQSKTTLQIST